MMLYIMPPCTSEKELLQHLNRVLVGTPAVYINSITAGTIEEEERLVFSIVSGILDKERYEKV